VVDVSSNAACLELLRVFDFAYAGSRIALPLGAQRLLAMLALNSDGMCRGAAAEQLWPDCPPSRAAANLRTALCQGRQACSATVIDSIGQRLRLAPSVRVDLSEAWESARQVIAGFTQLPPDCDTYVVGLTRELLPNWSDHWLALERERWDQMRIHALESLAKQFQTAEQYLPGLQVALAAIAVDQIRETAHRIVIEIHVAEGNVASALMHYRHYQALLEQELDVAPSQQMTRLVETLISV